MDKLLGNMSHYVLHYADDILIASDKDLTHHIDLIGQVLQKLEEGGIKIRPSKLHVATDSVDFLGIKWQHGKLNIPEARVLAFKNYPNPTTAKKNKIVCMCHVILQEIFTKFCGTSKTIVRSHYTAS